MSEIFSEGTMSRNFFVGECPNIFREDNVQTIVIVQEG